MAVSIPHKIYSMRKVLNHKKANPFVKYGHLHLEYAANLMASGEYYYCHWVPSLGMNNEGKNTLHYETFADQLR